MNTTKTPTSDKIMIPLRLPPDTYRKLMYEVQKQKLDKRGFSVNEFLTQLIEKRLKEKNYE